MDQKTYVNACNTVQIAAGLLLSLPLSTVLAAIDQAEAVGPIFDPTLYRHAHAKLDAQRRLVAAAIPLQAEIHRQRLAAQRPE